MGTGGVTGIGGVVGIGGGTEGGCSAAARFAITAAVLNTVIIMTDTISIEMSIFFICCVSPPSLLFLKVMDNARIGIKCCVTSVCRNSCKDAYLAGGSIETHKTKKRMIKSNKKRSNNLKMGEKHHRRLNDMRNSEARHGNTPGRIDFMAILRVQFSFSSLRAFAANNVL